MRVQIPKEAFCPAYLPLLREEKRRYLVLYGGAGSGKSVFAVQRLLVRLMERPMCNVLVARAVAATHRDSTYALFRQVIRRWGLDSLFRCAQGELRVTCRNGNAVIFKGLDDPEKLKSVTFPQGELTDVWVEEASELSEAQFNQLDLRLRGRGASRQMTLTFNPISTNHWLKARFFDRQDPRALVKKTTYRDNPFLDRAYIRTLEGYRESDPYYYQVYCLGEWGVLGRGVFQTDRLAARLGELSGPLYRGDFLFRETAGGGIEPGSVQVFRHGAGFASVYQEPEPGEEYVIGGDTAGEGSDFFVGQVLSARTGRQVCTLRGRMDEDQYARQMFCLGMWYNRALLAVEANYSAYPLRELARLGYPNQYVRGRDEGGAPGAKLGFLTTSATRPVILAGLVEIVREHVDWLEDRDTIEELMSFVRNSRGRMEAAGGAHDDCVMALAIGYYVRGRREGGGGESGFCAVER